jgi:hypothetical protein
MALQYSMWAGAAFSAIGAAVHVQFFFWFSLLVNRAFETHCKAGEANTILKTASCEAGPGTTLTYIYEIYIWSFLIQEFVDGCCYPNSNVTYRSVNCTMII